jgi:hypothetical protein
MVWCISKEAVMPLLCPLIICQVTIKEEYAMNTPFKEFCLQGCKAE